MAETRNAYDVIVIGAGHNGLTTAALLAQNGRKVLVIEQREYAGGLAACEEFHPGYRGTGILYDTSAVRHNLLHSLDLPRHGLQLETVAPAVFAPQADGDGFCLQNDSERARDAIRAFSKHDAERYADFRTFITRVQGVINGVLDDPPPDIFSTSARDMWTLFKKGDTLRRLGSKDALELFRVGPMSAQDWLDEYFETDLLKSVLVAPALHGTFMGPRSPGGALLVLLRECRAGACVRGGGVALVAALERAARANGVEVRTGMFVESILVSDGKVRGVRVRGGEEITAGVVAVSCDPKRTFLDLVHSRQITEKFERRITHYRMRGTAARVNIALNKDVELGGRRGERVGVVRIVEGMTPMEKAFDAVKYGRYSESPVLDTCFPTDASPDFAPAGHAVVSVLTHYVPYNLKGGWDSETREALGAKVVDTIARYVPDLRDAVVAVDTRTPVDIEATYGLTGGHIYHGEHAIDQLLVRPTPECARYATPIHGLYICGSGAHPGGGLTCAPGALAAGAILKHKD